MECQRHPAISEKAVRRRLSESVRAAGHSGLLENAGRVKAYGRHENADTAADSLDAFFEGAGAGGAPVVRDPPLLSSEDEVSDDASPALRQIRRSIRTSGERIHAQLNSMVNGPLRTYLQDAVITMRNGRYCIPVKSEYRSQVPV